MPTVFTQLSFSMRFTFSISQSLHTMLRTFTHIEAHDASGHNTIASLLSRPTVWYPILASEGEKSKWGRTEIVILCI